MLFIGNLSCFLFAAWLGLMGARFAQVAKWMCFVGGVLALSPMVLLALELIDVNPTTPFVEGVIPVMLFGPILAFLVGGVLVGLATHSTAGKRGRELRGPQHRW